MRNGYPFRPDPPLSGLDTRWANSHTEFRMQLSVKSEQDRARSQVPASRSLSDLRHGQDGVLESLDLPEDVSRRLMELGFLPGSRVTAARSAPGGDPKVYRVDGVEVALRKETARYLKVRTELAHE
jgi:ferrous iron transport protein A